MNDIATLLSQAISRDLLNRNRLHYRIHRVMLDIVLSNVWRRIAERVMLVAVDSLIVLHRVTWRAYVALDNATWHTFVRGARGSRINHALYPLASAGAGIACRIDSRIQSTLEGSLQW